MQPIRVFFGSGRNSKDDEKNFKYAAKKLNEMYPGMDFYVSSITRMDWGGVFYYIASKKTTGKIIHNSNAGILEVI